MKNSLKILVFATAFSLINCSSDDGDKNKLALPATLENNTLLAIPDATGNSCGSATTPGSAGNSIIIDNDGIIKDPSKVSIVLNLEHAYGGDFVVMLTAPSGDSCTLIKRLGSSEADTSCGEDFNFVSGNLLTFNSGNEIFIDSEQAAVPAGDYAPSSGLSAFPADAVMTDLETFLQNQDIKGEWKINVRDCGALDTGSLVSWKLVFDTGALK